MLRALSVNGFPSLWAGRLDLRYFDFPNRRSCPGCSTRWSYLMRLLVEWEMYALYRDLVSRLLGEELSNEAAESPPRCSSNGGGVMRGAASLGGQSLHQPAWYRAFGGQLQPSPHWSYSGWWDDKVRHQCYARIEDIVTP